MAIAFCTFVGLLSSINLVQVNAKSKLYTTSIDLTTHNLDYYLDKLPDCELKDGDSFINVNDLEYAADESQNDVSLLSSYEYRLKSVETYRNYGVVKCKYLDKVAANTSTSTSTSVSYSFNNPCEAVTLETSVTVSTSYQKNGPSSTDKVDSTTYATHYYYFNAASGKIMKYTYEVVDQYTGYSQGTVVKYFLTNQSNNTYSVLANLNASNNLVKFRSISSSRVVNENESTLLSYLNNSTGFSHVY